MNDINGISFDVRIRACRNFAVLALKCGHLPLHCVVWYFNHFNAQNELFYYYQFINVGYKIQ